jgi:hypothetical protein
MYNYVAKRTICKLSKLLPKILSTAEVTPQRVFAPTPDPTPEDLPTPDPI